MLKKYSPEQYQKLLEKLPEELQRAILSFETTKQIDDICKRNELNDELTIETGRYTGRVLLGVLPTEEFAKTLERELKIEKEQAKKISWEINRFIFYPVKEALWRLYHPSPLDKPEPGPSSTEEKPTKKQQESEKPDTYRESID